MTQATPSAYQEDRQDLQVQRHRDLLYFPHWHSDIEGLFVSEGRIRITCNLETATLGPGSTAVFLPGDVHCFESEGPSESIVFRIRPDLLDPELQQALQATRFRSPFHDGESFRASGLADRIESAFRTALEEDTHPGSFRRTAVLCRVTEFFVLAFRIFPTRKAEDRASARDRYNIALMQDIMAYIDRSLADRISLDSISDHFHLCPFYFSRLFKRMFGINLKEYVNRTRTRRAKELLLQTDLKITSISFECGYGSVRQFNRIFRENTGRTPSDFREMRFDGQVPEPAVAV